MFLFTAAALSSDEKKTAVLSVLDNHFNRADEKLESVLALPDLSAAFDTLDHAVLLKRLELTFGISGTVLDWCATYFSSREQSVIITGTVPRLLPVL